MDIKGGVWCHGAYISMTVRQPSKVVKAWRQRALCSFSSLHIWKKFEMYKMWVGGTNNIPDFTHDYIVHITYESAIIPIFKEMYPLQTYIIWLLVMPLELFALLSVDQDYGIQWFEIDHSKQAQY